MKFFIALVLSLAIFGFATAQQTQGTPGGYTPIQWNENNEELVNILDYGLQNAIPEAIAAGKLSKGNWTWIKVNSVEGQVVVGMNYKFNVDIFDGNRDVAFIDFVVYDDLQGNMSLESWEILKL